MDEYQVMMYAMSVQGGPAHNGTWDRVKCMFKDVDCDDRNSGNLMTTSGFTFSFLGALWLLQF